MKKILLFLLISVSTFAYAQKENNIWYFGKYAGLDFNSGSPVPLTNSAMNTWEGSASVADPVTGNLLFYTNGEIVWNRNHVAMPNGNGLWGQYSSCQSSLIIPFPGSSTEYYIFTTDAATGGFPNGGYMAYSVVDMSLASGNGDVTLKNIALFDTTTEKLTATLNHDGCKVWVLGHRWMSNEFYAYLVSDSGISAPVISATGSIQQCAAYGQMKVSPDGTHLALPLPCDSVGDSYVQLFDFDNATGIVSNGILLPQDHLVYGIEFSPGSQYLYLADHNNSLAIMYKQVAQYDVTAGSAAAIISSRIIVGEIWNATTFFNGSAQLGPDGKIYIVPTDKDSLCVINYPDSAGLACNFVLQGLYIINQNDHGLPNRVVTAQLPCAAPVAIFNAQNNICPGTCTDFNNLSQGADNYIWTFPGSSTPVSVDENPTGICYTNPGSYSVTLIASSSVTGLSDTLTLNNYITVFPTPPAQGILQSGDTLIANQGSVQYQWYFNNTLINGATDYLYIATQSGNYSVVATDENSCEVEAVINNVVANAQLAPDSYRDGNLQLAIYPNPVVETLYLDFASTGMNYAFSIYNILGEKVLESKNTFQKDATIAIDCRQMQPGIYFLQITGKENTRIKFTVQR
jgi:hypothetical protein